MYEIPISQGLVKPIYLLGAPRMITIFNLLIGFELFFILKAWWIIFFCIGIQMIGNWMGKSDPDFLEIFIRHLKDKDYYGV